MDKYQNVIIEELKNNSCTVNWNDNSVCFDISKCKRKKAIVDNTIIIEQEEDITLTKYKLFLQSKVIDKIFAVQKGQFIEFEKENNGARGKKFTYILDFANQIDSIIIKTTKSITDDIVLPVVYKEADKEKYYAKKEKERKDYLLKTANIKVSTGVDLVNIYFQPCCDSYARAEITLYKNNMMLAKYKVDEETFFKSINGLAYGEYEFILKQFDDKGNNILETDKISFSISRPTHTGMNVVNVI